MSMISPPTIQNSIDYLQLGKDYEYSIAYVDYVLHFLDTKEVDVEYLTSRFYESNPTEKILTSISVLYHNHSHHQSIQYFLSTFAHDLDGLTRFSQLFSSRLLDRSLHDILYSVFSTNEYEVDLENAHHYFYWCAFYSFARTDDSNCHNILRGYLVHSDHEIRLSAAISLSNLKDKEAQAVLVTSLEEDIADVSISLDSLLSFSSEVIYSLQEYPNNQTVEIFRTLLSKIEYDLTDHEELQFAIIQTLVDCDYFDNSIPIRLVQLSKVHVLKPKVDSIFLKIGNYAYDCLIQDYNMSTSLTRFDSLCYLYEKRYTPAYAAIEGAFQDPDFEDVIFDWDLDPDHIKNTILKSL